MSSLTSTNMRRRGIAAVTAVAAAVGLAALAASSVSADPPPAAAGNTSHGFLVNRGVVTTIDHPKATTITRHAGRAGGDCDHGHQRPRRDPRRLRRPQPGHPSLRPRPEGPLHQDRRSSRRERLRRVHRHQQPRRDRRLHNDDRGFTTTGFLRSKKGRFRSIDVPGSQVTGPLKINDRRQVVGIYLDRRGDIHGFLWDGGRYKTIDVPGAEATLVLGINDRGQMVGSYIDADGAYHGFLRDRRGAVTTLPEVPGADPTMGGTQPANINDRGQIVGLAYDARGGSRGFLLEDGDLTLIDAARRAVFTRPLDINNRGQIVGDYATRPPAGASSSRLDSANRRAGWGLPHRLGLSLLGAPASMNAASPMPSSIKWT